MDHDQLLQDKIVDLVKNSTEAVGGGYFQLEIEDSDSVYRERVYCYELYHQMRCVWGDGTDLIINGEVDKTKHPSFDGTALRRTKPDFLIHRPGCGNENHTVIEVKKVDASDSQFGGDIRKLNDYIELAGYKQAFYLFFGSEEGAGGDVSERVRNAAKGVDFGEKKIQLWHHKEAGKPAELLGDLTGKL